MRGAADRCGFLGRNATKAKIMQFERKQRGIAGAHEGFADHLFNCSRECGDGDGIPDLQQHEFPPNW